MENNPEEVIVFPEDLTLRDRELVLEQCQNQNATSREQIEGFANAYQKAKNLAQNKEFLDKMDGSTVLEFILELAFIIENRNEKGFRKVEVTFGVGETALPASLVEETMSKYAEAYAENRFTPVEAYKEFEDIHPFEDGNGRVGDLLWKIASQRQTAVWPVSLPPNIYRDDSVKIEKQSAFGEIEE